MDRPGFFDTRIGRWVPAALSLAVPAVIIFVGLTWRTILAWHAWPGFYVAILGFGAFAMPFLKKDPYPAERALWVVGGAIARARIGTSRGRARRLLPS
jgi:hypothetical protein